MVDGNNPFAVVGSAAANTEVAAQPEQNPLDTGSAPSNSIAGSAANSDDLGVTPRGERVESAEPADNVLDMNVSPSLRRDFGPGQDLNLSGASTNFDLAAGLRNQVTRLAQSLPEYGPGAIELSELDQEIFRDVMRAPMHDGMQRHARAGVDGLVERYSLENQTPGVDPSKMDDPYVISGTVVANSPGLGFDEIRNNAIAAVRKGLAEKGIELDDPRVSDTYRQVA